MTRRTLTLKRERLAELATDDLLSVAGAADGSPTIVVCESALAGCNSLKLCTTFPSCTCPPTSIC